MANPVNPNQNPLMMSQFPAAASWGPGARVVGFNSNYPGVNFYWTYEQLTSGFGQVQSDWNETNNTEPDYIKNKPTIPAAQVPSDWNSVSGVTQILNKPTIPAAQVNADWTAVSGLAEILHKPTIPAAQVNSDWNASSGVAQIFNKPTIPAAQVNSDWNSIIGLSQILNKPNLAVYALLSQLAAQGSPDGSSLVGVNIPSVFTGSLTAALTTLFSGDPPSSPAYLFAQGEITITAPAAGSSVAVAGVLTTDHVVTTIKIGSSGTIGTTATSVLGACYADGSVGRVYATTPYTINFSNITVYFQVWRNR